MGFEHYQTTILLPRPSNRRHYPLFATGLMVSASEIHCPLHRMIESSIFAIAKGVLHAKDLCDFCPLPMNFLRFLKNPKAVARYLLWRLGVNRYQAAVPLFLIKRHVPPASIVVEAGAHLGEDSVRIVEILKPKKLFAFEPVPHLFEILKERTRSLASVECVPCALGEKAGTSPMHVSSGYHELPGNLRVAGDGSSSLLKPTGHLDFCPTVEFTQQIDVPVTTLEKFASEHALQRIDFMWLDLQGMELKALEGAGPLLRTVSSIYLEASASPLYEGAPTFSEVEQWMRAHGFVPKYVAIPKDGHGNALFIKA